MSKELIVLDLTLGATLLLIVVLPPWMLGATTKDSIFLLNALGYLAGAIWIIKCVVRSRTRGVERTGFPGFGSSWPMVFVWVLVITLLIYVLCSGLNPRASLIYTFTPGFTRASGVEIEYLEPIEWLPHTYDKGRTLRAFWKYLAIMFSFAAARDWLMGASRRERRHRESIPHFPGDRMQYLLWTFAVNSATIALIGILQRLDGTQMLLWNFTNHMNGGWGAFGPFPYQTNGAQYLNLMWPVTLGFWWVMRRPGLGRRFSAVRHGGDPHLLLLVLAALPAVGVVFANSRGGLLVMLGLLFVTFAMLIFGYKANTSFKISAVVAVAGVVGFGGWFGGEALVSRFRSEDLGYMSGRKLIYEEASRMAADFRVFGSGAETFAPLHYFYRNEDAAWNAYVHNDYLETLVTFGAVGCLIISSIYISICLVPLYGNGIRAPGGLVFMIGIAMVGILIHAKFDLPFQIYSLHLEFVILCALLSTLKLSMR